MVNRWNKVSPCVKRETAVRSGLHVAGCTWPVMRRGRCEWIQGVGQGVDLEEEKIRGNQGKEVMLFKAITECTEWKTGRMGYLLAHGAEFGF